jgi:sirohydrochlorin cobaltochelatase
VKRDLTQALARWISQGRRQIGEVLFLPTDHGFLVHHHLDSPSADLETHTDPNAARRIAVADSSGEFRPIKTTPNLRRGWLLKLPDITALRTALEALYPAMLGSFLSFERGELQGVHLRETVGRQSGMYAITKKVTDNQALAVIARNCNSEHGCLKAHLWQIDPTTPVSSLPASKTDPAIPQLPGSAPFLPLLCAEACNLLVAKFREEIKKTPYTPPPADAAPTAAPPHP